MMPNINGSQVAVVFFSLRDQASFDRTDYYMHNVRFESPTALIVLVGTMSDYDEEYRAVKEDEIKEKAQNYGVNYFLTSYYDDVSIKNLADYVIH